MSAAGYSGTPLPQKLGIKAGMTVAVIGAPPGFERTLGRLAEGVTLRRDRRAMPDLLLWFITSRAQLSRGIPRLRNGFGAGGFWVCWPKKASGVKTDLTEDVVRAAALPLGLVDYKVCAVDATWSGLKFARRKGA